MKYGRLTVIGRAPNQGPDRHAYLECWCACTGEIITVRGDALRSGAVVSCGCYRADPKVRSKARRAS